MIDEETEDAYDSNDPKDVKKRKAAEKNAENLQVDDLKFLMKQPQFRRFMWHLLTISKMFEVSDPHSMERPAGFFDGQRNIGLRYFANVQESCPEQYLEMVNESKKKGYDDDD